MILTKLAISCGNRRDHNHSLYEAHSREAFVSGRAIAYNFQQIGETDFSLFRTFRPRTAGFKQKKSQPAHHRLSKRSGHEQA